MKNILYLLFCYLLGSVPFAYIISKIFRAIDIRTKGSGNVGATNVLRVIGLRAGIVVLILDVLKGFLAVKLAPPEIIYLGGLFVIIGHCWTVFLKFKGGKGVATALGVLLAVEPLYLLIFLLIWLGMFFIFGIVSLSSVSAALFLPLVLIFKGTNPGVLIFISLYSGILIFRHKKNIEQLLKGEEKKIGFKKK